MTAMLDRPISSASAAATMTAGRLRDLLGELADDTPVQVGVYSDRHVNNLLGTMPVTSARVMRGADRPALILGVAGM